MDYNGCGLTYRKPYAAGRARRPRGAGLTYRKPYGAGQQATGIVEMATSGDIAAAGLALGSFALGALMQYYIIKYAVRAARKR